MTIYSAVSTTGIYCRPGCGARPLATNVRTFDLPAAAEAAGFRACYRCRPYRVAGPVPADAPELVCQVVQLIIDGALDGGGTETDLAGRVGLSTRHLRRLFRAQLGATPDQLARSRRAHFARRLLDDTDLAVIDVAFASGFGSLRQFNRTMQEVFRAAPTDLRERRHRTDRLVADGGLLLRLPVLPGYDWDSVRTFLAGRAVPGVESVDDDSYRRTIMIGGAPGLLEVSPGRGDLLLRVHLPYWEGLIHVVDRVGRLLGMDTDHGAGVAALRTDPVLGALAAERPGLAVPGAWSAFEVGVWAILSRDRDPAAAGSLLQLLVTGLGVPVPGLPAGLTHAFPEPQVATTASLQRAGIPAADAADIAKLGAAIRPATGAGARSGAEILAALNGSDPYLREYLAFRLGRRDAFPAADPSLLAAMAHLGRPGHDGQPDHADGPAAPEDWRALAAMYLMVAGERVLRERVLT
jgi:AraC family transcriptional regulator of adaptative response / DNA-3-methyladenine glycosylase II